MRYGEALTLEIQAHDHAQQQFRRAVRIVMPELPAAHGPLQPFGQTLLQRVATVAVQGPGLFGEQGSLRAQELAGDDHVRFGQALQVLHGER